MLHENIGPVSYTHLHHYGSDAGAEMATTYHSVIGTVKLHGSSVWNLSLIHILPVRLFKEFELRSVPKEEIAKTMTSSGTTGQQKSQIFVDRTTCLLYTS